MKAMVSGTEKILEYWQGSHETATEHIKSRDMDIISNIKLEWLKNKMKRGKTV